MAASSTGTQRTLSSCWGTGEVPGRVVLQQSKDSPQDLHFEAIKKKLLSGMRMSSRNDKNADGTIR